MRPTSASAFARSVGLAAPLGSSLAFSWLDALGVLGRWREAETLLPEIIDLFDNPSIEGYLGQAGESSSFAKAASTRPDP